MNIQSNLPGSSLEHVLPPLQLEFFFSVFSAGKRLSCSTHWSSVLKARNTERSLRHCSSCRSHATSDRRRMLAAVGLSLLWAAFSPGATIAINAMVARGIKHSGSPTHVCSLNENSSTGRQQNLVSES
jgi:hypothetical protein